MLPWAESQTREPLEFLGRFSLAVRSIAVQIYDDARARLTGLVVRVRMATRGRMVNRPCGRQSWDAWFDDGQGVTHDFMADRDQPPSQDR